MKDQINAIFFAINANENDQEMRDMYTGAVKQMLDSCAEYVHIVVNQEQRIQMARFRMEGEEFRSYVMSLDTSRRFAHNSLMTDVNVCNRVCKIVGVAPVAPDVSNEDRETYGAFAMKVVEEYFDEKLAH